MSRLSARRRSRTVAAVLTVAVLGAVLGVGVTEAWSELDGRRESVAAERRGVTYLRPLTTLIGALTAAQSAAVAGRAVEAGDLRAAMAAVSAADTAHGTDLETGSHWPELRQRIDTLLGRPGAGHDAYRDFGDAVSLAMQLRAHVGSTSGLVLDVEPDTHYLVDVGLRQLPDVMLNAGRVVDLVALPPGPDTAGERAAAIAVARYEVAVAAGEIKAGLQRSVLNTDRSELGTGQQEQQVSSNGIDLGLQFQNAVDALTPPTLVRRLGEPVSGAQLSAFAARVNSLAAPFAANIWSAADLQLAQRQDDLAARARLLATGAAVTLGGFLALLWLFAPDRRTSATGAAADDAPAPDEARFSMIDARDLLGTEELVRVGRAVQARPRERDRAQ